MANLVVKIRFREGTTLKRSFVLSDFLSTVHHASMLLDEISVLIRHYEETALAEK